MTIIKPPRLQLGDTIGVVSPSQPVLLPAFYNRGIAKMKDLGFIVKEGRSVCLQSGYMSGPDEARAADIMDMFLDPEVKAIVCQCGGSCANRVLPYLDYDQIAQHPKIFSGVSDITTFHLAFQKMIGMMSLHQVDVCFGFGGDPVLPAIRYTLDLFMQVCMNPLPLGPIPLLTKWEVWRPGKARGRVMGGHINQLLLTLGTPYCPDFSGVILFWEAYGKQIHELDMILTAFKLAGVLDRIEGMLVGKCVDCRETEYAGLEPSLRDLIVDITSGYHFPIIGEMDFGHDNQNMPLPEGMMAEMDTDGPSLTLLESMVE